MNCPNCGNDNSDTSKFCTKCGMKLQKNEIPAYTKFSISAAVILLLTVVLEYTYFRTISMITSLVITALMCLASLGLITYKPKSYLSKSILIAIFFFSLKYIVSKIDYLITFSRALVDPFQMTYLSVEILISLCAATIAFYFYKKNNDKYFPDSISIDRPAFILGAVIVGGYIVVDYMSRIISDIFYLEDFIAVMVILSFKIIYYAAVVYFMSSKRVKNHESVLVAGAVAIILIAKEMIFEFYKIMKFVDFDDLSMYNLVSISSAVAMIALLVFIVKRYSNSKKILNA